MPIPFIGTRSDGSAHIRICNVTNVRNGADLFLLVDETVLHSYCIPLAETSCSQLDSRRHRRRHKWIIDDVESDLIRHYPANTVPRPKASVSLAVLMGVGRSVQETLGLHEKWLVFLWGDQY